MGVTHDPEVLMARKLIKLNGLKIPFNLDELVAKYAKVVYKSIPVEGIDGVCLNLKMPGKTPVVIVNSDAVRARQKFTLAHELGHIIIPWHLGTFIDEIDANNDVNANTEYWEMEREANRFASELLMPLDWIYSLFKKNPDSEFLLSNICSMCGVSDTAARIRIFRAIDEILEIEIPGEEILKLYEQSEGIDGIQKIFLDKTQFNSQAVARQMAKHLPGKIAYTVEQEGYVISAGGTEGTQIHYQAEGSKFDPNPYPNYSQKITNKSGQIQTHWWVLDVELQIPEDDRNWQDILDKIVGEINPKEGIDKFKRIVNGKMSGLNSTRKSKNKYTTIDEFIAEANHRFNDQEYISLIEHKDFLVFLKKRSEAFFAQ